MSWTLQGIVDRQLFCIVQGSPSTIREKKIGSSTDPLTLFTPTINAICCILPWSFCLLDLVYQSAVLFFPKKKPHNCGSCFRERSGALGDGGDESPFFTSTSYHIMWLVQYNEPQPGLIGDIWGTLGFSFVPSRSLLPGKAQSLYLWLLGSHGKVFLAVKVCPGENWVVFFFFW